MLPAVTTYIRIIGVLVELRIETRVAHSRNAQTPMYNIYVSGA